MQNILAALVRESAFKFLPATVVSVSLVFLFYSEFFFSNTVGIFDWQKDGFMLGFFAASIRDYGTFPRNFLVIPPTVSWYPTLAQTHAYFPNPEVFTISIFALFAFFMTTLNAFKATLAIHLLCGVIGTYLIARHLSLNLFLYIILLATTVLNPWLMQHLAIGYTPWINVELIPLIVWCLFCQRVKSAYILAALLSAQIIYQGGLHVWIWMNAGITVSAFIYAFLTKSLYPLLRIAIFFAFSTALALPKVIATAGIFAGWRRNINLSYSSLSDLVGLLTDDVTKLYNLPQAYNIYGTALYDGSTYMGWGWIIACGSAIIFMLIRQYRGDGDKLELSWTLTCSGALFVLLGWNGVWSKLAEYIPLLTIEIYPFRFLIISVVLFSALVTIQLRQLQLSNRKLGPLLIFMFMIFIVFPVYKRNLFFSRKAVSGKSEFLELKMAAYLKQNIVVLDTATHVPIDIAVSPAAIVINLPEQFNGQISLPWLSQSRWVEFNLEGGSWDKSDQENSNTYIQPMPGVSSVSLTPKFFGR